MTCAFIHKFRNRNQEDYKETRKTCVGSFEVAVQFFSGKKVSSNLICSRH